MERKTITVYVGLGGKVSLKTTLQPKDSVGKSIARMIADDLVGYAEVKAEALKASWDVLITDGSHDLHFMGSPVSKRITASIDSEKVKRCDLPHERFDIVAEFIGYDLPEWRTWKVEDKVSMRFDDFDGKGVVNCYISSVHADHAVAMDADANRYYIDDTTQHMFEKGWA